MAGVPPKNLSPGKSGLESGYRVPYPVLQFLLFSCIPAGNILQVTRDTADLHHVVGPAVRADGVPAEGAVLDPGDDVVGAPGMVEGTEDLEPRLAAPRAGRRVHDGMAGMALITPFRGRDVLEGAVLPDEPALLWTPLHT